MQFRELLLDWFWAHYSDMTHSIINVAARMGIATRVHVQVKLETKLLCLISNSPGVGSNLFLDPSEMFTYNKQKKYMDAWRYEMYLLVFMLDISQVRCSHS
jgi:hypothetical protein